MLKKKGSLYQLMGFGIVLLFCFFLSSRLLIQGPHEYKNTPLRKKVQSNLLTEEMTSKTFFTDKNILVVGFMIEPSTNAALPDLRAKVQEESNLKAKYKTDFIQITEQYYVLFVQSLPSKWTSVSVQISEKGSNSNGISSPKKLYIAHPKTKIRTHFVKESKAYYENQYLELLIADAKKAIEKAVQKQQNFHQDIKKTHSKIKSLTDELSYQVGQGKVDMQTNITSLKGQIKDDQIQIKESQNAAQEQQKKIRLLKKKQQSLHF